MEHDHSPQPLSDAAGGSIWEWLSGGFMPHGHCYLWQPGVLWTTVVSDLLIAFSYYSIPIILFSFVSKRRDVPFNSIFIIFGLFIFACGTSHVMDVITVWQPIYWVSAAVKALTAMVSLIAVAALVPIIPKALALPSLRMANEQLQRTTTELRRSNQELEQFAYVSSHDLQEPLRMVTMYLDLLDRQAPDLDEKAKNHLAKAQSGAMRMQELINGLLSYSRIGRAAEAGTCSAEDALQDALTNLEASIVASGTHITRSPLPRVRIDRTQLTQVFQNLIGNAIKYGTTKEPWVHITVQREGDHWVFSIQDNGIGIDPQYHERIFEVFQRLHDRNAYGGGTGIGLAVCKKIIERHDGRISVESQPGIGSIFHFSLPAA